MNFKLNDMELTIMECIFHGKNNSEISEILDVPKDEVMECVNKLCRKFGVANRLQMMLKYYL